MAGRWGVGVVVLAAAVLASCAGSDGPAEPLEPTESIVVESSVAVTTSTLVAASTTSTSTSSSTTSTTTTEPLPSTTTVEDLRREIEDDLNEGERVFIAGAATPGDPAAMSALAGFFIDGSLAITQGFYEEWARNGWVLQPNPVVESRTSVLEVVDSSPGQARVLTCRIDAAVLVDGLGEPINDEIVRYTNLSVVTNVDGVWRLSGGETVAVDSGDGQCGSS